MLCNILERHILIWTYLILFHPVYLALDILYVIILLLLHILLVPYESEDFGFCADLDLQD